jgi:hypothetical protein
LTVSLPAASYSPAVADWELMSDRPVTGLPPPLSA